MEPIYLVPIIPIALIFAGIYFTFFAKKDQARQFMQRLFMDEDKEERIKRIQQQHFVLKKRRKEQSPYLQRLDMDLERANLMIKPNEFILVCFGVAILGFLIPFVLGKGFLFAILGAIAGLFTPKLFLKVKIMLRMAKAQSQFADVLDMMVSCFKTGYGFSRSVQAVSENFTDPWSTELNKVVIEMNFGSTQDDALIGLSKRLPNPDVALFVTAMMIQKETGGNMVELLTNLSKTIRERYKLFSKVKALSAQGTLSAIIVFCIPFGLAGVFTLIFPDMMSQFAHHPIGIGLIIFAALMQGIGGFVLKRIVTLEV